MADSLGGNNVLNDSIGNQPKVDELLQVTNRTIAGVDQAFAVCETMISDRKKGILQSARITQKLNGQRPYNEGVLKNSGKSWKTNISTGFLASECNKIVPRFFMPIKTAKYLTAAELPANWPAGQEKTQFFRQVITDKVRAWNKFNFYIRGLSREVAVFGYASNAWFDNYGWKPTLLRTDKGFVPQGTELMEEPTFFLAKWDYKPNELLDLLRENVEAGRSEWQKDNVIQAINNSYAPPVDSTYPQARTYEELIRQSTWGYTYTKGARVIRTWHLFAKEATGKVSHYVLLSDSGGTSANQNGSPMQQSTLLYENLDQFDSMADAVKVMVFDYGDGTIHGSWGAGQILYDLAVQVEKVRCDSVDNIRLSNKVKVQVPDGKNVNDVKQLVNDNFIIVSGAQLAGNTAGLQTDINGYEILDQKLTQIAQQKIGAFVPPIPLQPSDIKAAQINAAMSKEKELQEALLENWLIQWADVMRTITKRLCDPTSPDPDTLDVRAKLLELLTEEEIGLLVNQFPVKSVMDFTEYKAQQRAAFAASVMNNPLFKQGQLAKVMAEGIGDATFVDMVTLPDGDQTEQLAAQRQQILENAAMSMGDAVPILPNDNDWVHMQTLKPKIQQSLVGDQVNDQLVELWLRHYAAHWEQGVSKKTIPKEAINDEKQWIAASEKALNAHRERAAMMQQAEMVQKDIQQQADQLVANGEA